ncbi:MAG: bifunctional 3,4-dihydroxy-2-butanone-4-phosphate synthase/GTP cyclohydrolase II [Candidatus Sumerlaeia bacterium]|nr:bifunctional 3,4-dihydroxy-2-butanone-4-phosphate synthase/GTP cyclohydrolase II [Candidatus Sumerlaeia bacterium]
MTTSSHIATVEQAIAEIRKGRIIIVVDDEDRENEGDFIMAASAITPETVNFMAKHGRGLICVPAPSDRLAELDLEPMVRRNTAPHGTNFTVSVDAKGVSTGISAADRALTIHKFVEPETTPDDLLRPGHIFPLEAKAGGVLVRAGHTEAAVDLARLAGLPPVGVLCEILNDDGTMARLPQLEEVAEQHGLVILTIRDLIAYRTANEKLVRRLVSTQIPNPFGLWTMHLYENTLNREEIIVLVLGEPEKQDSALIRVHSKCFTGDTLLSFRCDCGPQLMNAMESIAREGHGVIVYMDHEGRGIGLRAKMEAYNLQAQGMDTVEANLALGYPADLREYGIGVQILADLGLKRIRILSNNPKKIVGISGFGVEIVDRVPIQVGNTPWNEAYLRAKAMKMGHLLKFDDAIPAGMELGALLSPPVSCASVAKTAAETS